MVSKKYYYDIDLRGNRLLNFAVESVSGELPSEANEGAMIYHTGEGVMYQRLKDGWKVIASGKDLEDALSKVSEDLEALSRDTEEALDDKADKTTVSSLSNTLTKEIQDRQAGDTTNAAAISTHVANKSNPHGVTKAQVGLSNVDNTSDVNKPISTATQNALDGKQATLRAGTNITIANDGVTISAKDTTYGVATTSANGLMSSSDKSKLDGIATGANKTTVDTALSSTSTNPVQNKVIHTALSGKAGTSVATQSANGLMSSADKKKLDGIASGAQVNVIETIKVNNTALGVSGKAVNIDLSDYAKKGDVTTVMRYKGSVATVTSLPTTATLGDTYNVIDTNANYTWDGSAWDLIGSTVDLSGYATKTEVTNQINAEASARSSADTTLQTNIDGKVSKTGDTMTGPLKFDKRGIQIDYDTTDGTPIQINNTKNGNMSVGFTTNGLRTSLIRSNESDTNKVISLFVFGSEGAFSNYGALTCNYIKETNEFYANAPSFRVGTNDNSNKILTIKMANSLPSLVHSTGNEMISGDKTFTSPISVVRSGWDSVKIKNTNVDMTSAGAWNVITGLSFYAMNNGTEMDIARYSISTDADGNPRTVIQTRRMIDGVVKYGEINLKVLSNGNSYATAPTTPTNATSNEIATANWTLGKFVKKTGDTMTGNLTIAKDGVSSLILKRTDVNKDQPTYKQLGVIRAEASNGMSSQIEFLRNTPYGHLASGVIISAYNSTGTQQALSIYSFDDGVNQEAYVQHPSWRVGINDNSDKSLTIKMANSLPSLVHTTGNETVAGTKTFTANVPLVKASDGQFLIQATNVVRGTTPNTNTSVGRFRITDGANATLGELFSTLNTDGSSTLTLCAIKNQTSRADAYIVLGWDADGTQFATAPTTPINAISNEIATANWCIGKFVQKTGDTMTGNLKLQLADPRLDMVNTRYVRGTAPGGTCYWVAGRFLDSSSTPKPVMSIEATVLADERRVYQFATISNNDVWSYPVKIVVNSDNTGAYMVCPTPASKSENSTQVATTAWVNQSDFLVHTTGTEDVRGFKKFTNPYWNVGGIAFKDPRYGITSADKPLFNGAFKYLSQFPLFDMNEAIISNDIVQTNADNSIERVAIMRDSTNTQRTIYSIKLNPSDGGVTMVLRTNPPNDANGQQVTTANWVNTKLAQKSKVTAVTSYTQLIELIKNGKRGDSFGLTMDYTGGSLGGITATNKEVHAFGHYTIDEITVSGGALTGLQAFGSGEVSGKLKDDDSTTYTYATTGFGRQVIGNGVIDAFRVVEDGKLTYFVPNDETTTSFEGYYISI